MTQFAAKILDMFKSLSFCASSSIKTCDLVSDQIIDMILSLGSCREFGCRDGANGWRKSTKEADKHKIFFIAV